MDPLKINQTQITQYMKCPEQWRRRWIDGDIIPPARALIRGTAVHVAAAENFRQKINTKKDLPRADVLELAVNAVGNRIKTEGLLLTDEEKTVGAKAIQNEIEKEVVGFSAIFIDQVAPVYQPVMVEELMSFKLEPAEEAIEIYGTLDLLDTHQDIVDLKSAAKRPAADEYENSPQPTMYSLLKLLGTGTAARAVNMEILLVQKTSSERITQVLKKKKADFVALLHAIRVMARAMRAGIAVGSYGQNGAWWCSKKWCGYWGTCPFVPEHKR